jgi:hypothetical protein
MGSETRDTSSGESAALRPLVLLIDPDALSRARLARALVSEGFDVRLALDDFDDAERPRLAIVHLGDRAGNRSDVLGALVDGYPKVPVMLRATSPAVASAEAARLGVQVVQAFPDTEAFRDIVARARQMVVGVAHTVPPPAAQDGRSSFERLTTEALRRVPTLLIAHDDVGWFDGDPEERTLLTSIDGRSDLHALANKCRFDEPTALRLVDVLVARGLVALEDPR